MTDAPITDAAHGGGVNTAPRSDLLPILDAARRKYTKPEHPPLVAARMMMATAVRIFAEHADAAEAAAVCAETVADVRSIERRERLGG